MTEKEIHIERTVEVEAADSGMSAILRVFFRNPVAAVQLVGFFLTMFGVYYAIESEIRQVKADQIVIGVADRAEAVRRFETLSAKLDTLTNAETDLRVKTEAIYARGDVRYAAIISKLSEDDVKLATFDSKLDFLVKQFDRANNSGKPRLD